MTRSARAVLLTALMHAFLASGVGYSADSASQPAKEKGSTSDEMRAVYATSQDVAEGKRVAEASCSACHGGGGISASKGVPHLAGQRPAYVYLELKAYQSGARGVEAMNNAVRFLSDDALYKVAAYYASLDPAQPAAPSSGKPAPVASDPVQAGRSAAAACAGCHGESGVSKMPGVPSLVALDPKYLTAAMKAYKSGQRNNDTMKSMLATVSEADLSSIALYYALQKPSRAQTPAPGDQAAGKTAAAACAQCHGEKGVDQDPTIPSLAGQDAQYLAAALRSYKEGSRDNPTMKVLAAALDEPTTRNLAAFYANQQPYPVNVRKPLTTAEWAQRCDRCHGVDGNSTDPHLPALAAQREDYLEKVLHAYRTGERKSPQMAAMSEGLTEADVVNLAAYYSRQKARAVVYVVLPAK